MTWKCAECGREFVRANQRHKCGTGDSASIVRNRPDSLKKLYAELEEFAKSLGNIEVVARERYALFRSTRIFTDISVMKDCIRIAIHLNKKEEREFFIKIVSDKKSHTHVAKLFNRNDFKRVKPFIVEAYNFSIKLNA
ncbi:DUF5655 domain-containing protein [Puniceicoccaceae bacterium K14]|nr:DUF5655 domain-containing protein [Puniceicoccaceae bacterium K14]